MKSALRPGTKTSSYGESPLTALSHAQTTCALPPAALNSHLCGFSLLRLVDEKKAEVEGVEGKRASLSAKAVRLEATLQQKERERVELEAKEREIIVQAGQARSAGESLRCEEARLLKITSTIQVSRSRPACCDHHGQSEMLYPEVVNSMCGGEQGLLVAGQVAPQPVESQPQSSTSGESDNEEYVPGEVSQPGPTQSWISRRTLMGRLQWHCAACDKWFRSNSGMRGHAQSMEHRTLTQE